MESSTASHAAATGAWAHGAEGVAGAAGSPPEGESPTARRRQDEAGSLRARLLDMIVAQEKARKSALDSPRPR